ncbi:GNAT family N-acetyltransferase [Sinisalibacter lacisalsi]|uniref:N-acetyltransferase n=1 Tax=Sinisalibacter lacisalsi TaxID=1526570 RepID=A0ABQ1QR54_9RHOB|nr:N-acetyltransferase [Sinisalibacter lacisalsi]GGD37690.1 N-acetyltransferase [Sinisalibacter lacisalsi]
MLRPAKAGDEAAIEAFLAGYPDTSMFLRANLREHGLFDHGAPHATTFWIAGQGGVSAVFGLSNAGFAMSQARGADAALWHTFAEAAAGRMLAGIVGEVTEVALMKRALGLHSAAFSLDDPEPLYRLDLARLTPPSGPGILRKPTQDDRALLEEWFRGYLDELRMAAPERIAMEARERAARAIAGGETRILEVDGTPRAMSAINARLPDMVQIGGVFTPPADRGQGLARRVVALHLAEERPNGVTTAILFASGLAASRAYEAIGFARVGTYALAILKTPVTIGAQP